MSYDIGIFVKVDGTKDVYAQVAEPVISHPTYNLGEMFRACMDWDFNQSEQDKNGEYQPCYYNCSSAVEHLNRGIFELTVCKKNYEQYVPKNGFGSIRGAYKALSSTLECICETVRDKGIPLECLYMRW